ncbi:DUF1289 domain-containing protein [Psychrobium sp. 1_MG-2023]|uniref:DUF1289 domain-containing protein n=1 Tax=Psychrobium sp. 1_MG-2023 TaxID=3062624 RepID=UPI000C321764|nr:DUF1289 domain-containing protein [Psychrobium sp. 1_MG-2023]MDP2559720.1 DUF1289 domain-containing protein [Psychrobium sp. 1_MG-2023]PKF59549.1 DUF1289 domain-containing protein [Alteromonadales bacterium alter-6D02]
MIDNPLRSPCVALCKLNEDDICVGCHRTVQEIVNWSSSTDKEKKKILERIEQYKVEALATAPNHK